MSAIRKDFLRSIKNTFGRFLSIVLVVAIGAAFYAGFKMTGPNMRLTADKYFRDNHLMDVMVESNFSLDETDVDMLKELPEVLYTSGGITADAFTEKRGKNVKVMALFGNENSTNMLSVVEGRLPESPDECVVDGAMLSEDYPIGSTINLVNESEEVNDAHDVRQIFSERKFEVVGYVSSPLYISSNRGLSEIGNSVSDGFVIVSPEAFKASKVFTEIYIVFDMPTNISAMTSEYDEWIIEKLALVEETLASNKDSRYNQLREKPLAIIEEGEAKLAEMEGEIAPLLEDIEEGEAELKEAEGIATLDESELAENKTAYEEALAVITEDEGAYDEAFEKHTTLLDENTRLNTEINTINSELVGEREYLAQVTNLKLAAGLDPNQDDEVILLKADINTKETSVGEMQSKIASNSAAIIPLQAIIDEIGPTLSVNQAIVDKYEALLSEIQTSLDEKNTIVEAAQKKLDEANAAYDEAMVGSSDIRAEISEAEIELSKIGSLSYFASDRSTNPSYTEYKDNADRVDVIANVFPVFFIIVAILICMNTLKRMVDEETTLIGTYKALGYGAKSISFKYIFYALFATFLGLLIGLALGYKALPIAIMQAYGMMYNFDKLVTSVPLVLTIIIVAVSLLAMTITAIYCVTGAMRAAPSSLMRPKTPKMGKRVLLERFKGFWSKTSFTTKVVLRNISRYKQRMFMTIFGIAGATALMLAGFGFRNALTEVVDIQFNEILKYDMIVELDEGINKDERRLLDIILNEIATDNYFYYYGSSVKVSTGGIKRNVPANLVVVSDNSAEGLPNYITLRLREGKEPITLSSNGIIITEKMAELLGVRAGSNIEITDSNNDTFDYIRVDAIVENYTGHSVYMGEEAFTSIFNTELTDNNILLKFDNMQDEESHTIVSESIGRHNFVRSSNIKSNTMQVYKNIVDGMNVIVAVFIICAVALAFAVLYNLTVINISERKRELATFKVLGFTNREVSKFISGENIIYTIIGIAIGLFAGTFLSRFITRTAEMTDIMFGRTIKPLSFVLAAAIIVLFALIVNLLMNRWIKKINMVEALKSVD